MLFFQSSIRTFGLSIAGGTKKKEEVIAERKGGLSGGTQFIVEVAL